MHLHSLHISFPLHFGSTSLEGDDIDYTQKNNSVIRSCVAFLMMPMRLTNIRINLSD